MPKRIQRKRIKGWRMPEGAVNCTRPGRWGNPFRVDPYTLGQALSLFRALIEKDPEFKQDIKQELRGKDLACFCPLDQPCHVDILLEVANS